MSQEKSGLNSLKIYILTHRQNQAKPHSKCCSWQSKLSCCTVVFNSAKYLPWFGSYQKSILMVAAAPQLSEIDANNFYINIQIWRYDKQCTMQISTCIILGFLTLKPTLCCWASTIVVLLSCTKNSFEIWHVEYVWISMAGIMHYNNSGLGSKYLLEKFFQWFSTIH